VQRYLLLFLFLGITLAQANEVFSIKIEPSKKTYQIGETLKGEVLIDNDYPVPLPAVFEMKMYHNSRLETESQMSVKDLPPGRLPFTFEAFRIPEKLFQSEDLGTWEIVINQLHSQKLS